MNIAATINKINQEFIAEAKNSPSLLADMAAMERYMSESYCGRILVELLQNADDAGAKNVLITSWNGDVVVANDGRPFNDSDVVAISRSGASNKRRAESIGYRGVGFKSTSFLSENIYIYSSETLFCFSKSETAKALGVDKKSVPTIRIPFVKEIDEYKDITISLDKQGFTTIFIFRDSDKSVLQEEVSLFSEDLLLFLNNVNTVIIDIDNPITLSVERIKHQWGQEVKCNNTSWAIISGCLGFIYEDGHLKACEEDDSHYYSFLPTYDKCLYNIKINGNFSTDPSRKHIRLDEETKSTLQSVAKSISSIIQDAFNNPSELYKYIPLIFKYNVCFDYVNRFLKNEMESVYDHIIELPLNCGNSVRIKEYKAFPEDFDQGTIRLIRTTDGFVKENSLQPEVYDKIDGVETFIAEMSENKMSNQDIVDITCEESVVEKMPIHTYSFMLGKVVNSYNRMSLMQDKPLDISRVLYKDESGAAKAILDSDLTSSSIISILNENESNLDITPLRVKGVSNALNIKYEEDVKPLFEKETEPVVEQIPKEEPKEFVFTKIKTNKPIIAKWRSAENACIEIEKFLGNEARDVSAQNLGYDVESTTPDGTKRFIEVKSIKTTDSTFSITNNEYTSAHQNQENYFICLILQSDSNSKAIYIQNPLSKVHFEKRIRQWEWYCDAYEGEEIKIEY